VPAGGYDALLVPALRMGADGGINALSNVVPAVLREAFERAEDDRGRELQCDAISPLFEACTTHGFAPATKTALTERGIIPTDEVRPPLVAVDDAGTEAISGARGRARGQRTVAIVRASYSNNCNWLHTDRTAVVRSGVQ